jgi:hypothetical protein
MEPEPTGILLPRDDIITKDDDLVKRLNSMAKEKAPNSRRANPEE